MSMTPEQAADALGAIDIPTALNPTLGKIVFTAERGIKQRTPVRTGRLRRSVNGQVVSTTEGRVGTNLIYARPVHRNNPFIERGLDDVDSEIDALLAEGGMAIWKQVVR